MIWSNRMFAELTGRDEFYKKHISTIFPEVTQDKIPVPGEKDVSELSVQFGERIYRISMQAVSVKDVLDNSDMLEGTKEYGNLIAMYLYDENRFDRVY